MADRIVYQYDFADNDTDASDKNGHGSHVASIIGSSDSTYGGIAPGSDLIALKVFKDNGSGYFSDLEESLQWVINNATTYNIASVNLSLGDERNWTTDAPRYGIGDELAALTAKGIIVTAAAGNNYARFGSLPGLAYPAADPNTIAVGAVSSTNDQIADFSQRDQNLLDIFAPGISIVGANATGGTQTLSGTSQAAPHLAGIAVLAQQLASERLGRKLSVAEFDTLLKTTGIIINDGDDEVDSVTNTGLNFPRVNMMALADAILALNGNTPISTPGNTNDDSAEDPLYFPGSATGGSHQVTLVAGQIITNLDFGSQQISPPLASLGDRIWHDLNANGIQDDSEPGLPGFTINLYNTSDELLDSTVTDASGNYSFTNLLPGDYTVQIAPVGDLTVIPDPAFYLSSQNQGDDDTLDSDFDPISRSVAVTLSGGEDLQTLDAGLYRYANIYGQIFNDIDGNGQLDEGELGLTDWTVYLDANDNGSLDEGEQSTQTSADGSYAFFSLVPGTYTVAQVLRPNWQQTFPTEGALNTTVELSSFELIENLNFGNQSLSQKPILSINTGLTLNEGSNTTITPSQLQVTDADSAAVQLTYTLVNRPTNGNLLLNSNPLGATGTFTQADIDNNRLTYTHSGSETTSDSFSFTITDETGNAIGTTTFQITVNPIDDPPIVGKLNGGRLLGTEGADVLNGYNRSNGIAVNAAFPKTFGRDFILAGAGDDLITGGFNSDVLTGGEGRDKFIYTSLNDAADIITDFTPGTDKIVLTQLLKNIGYQGSNPIADGYVVLRSWGFSANSGSSYIQIDPDGSSGLKRPDILLLAQNVSLASLNNPSNFEF